MPELFSLLAATFSSCQVAWRFPCHRLAGWSCCGSCPPLRDVHLEWGADRPDSPSPQGLYHVIQASLQALSTTSLFPYTNEGMGLALIFWPICVQLQKQRSPTPPSHLQTDFLHRLGRLTLVASRFLVSGLPHHYQCFTFLKSKQLHFSPLPCVVHLPHHQLTEDLCTYFLFSHRIFWSCYVFFNQIFPYPEKNKISCLAFFPCNM